MLFHLQRGTDRLTSSVDETTVRIGIDNVSPGDSTSRSGPGGMRMYLQSLISEFSRTEPQHEFVVFTPEWAESLIDRPGDNVSFVRLQGVPVNRVNRAVYQQSMLPLAIARQHVDVFLATATIAPLLCSAPVVLTVQFLQFYRWAESAGRFRSTYLRRMLPLSLRKAATAIVFTESAKEDLVLLTGVPSAKVTVVPHGLAQHFKDLANLPAAAPERGLGRVLTGGKPYIVYVSATYAYKNHARLIEAFGMLKRMGSFAHVLVLAGSEVTVSFAELRAVAERAGVADEVIFAGRVEPDTRLACLYLGADVAVFPTLYETFGFPALEAMACGCPVVASNVGAVAELAGDAAALVDPLVPSSIADGVFRVLTNEVIRRDLSARGREHAERFTWTRCARSTLDILHQAYSKRD